MFNRKTVEDVQKYLMSTQRLKSKKINRFSFVRGLSLLQDLNPNETVEYFETTNCFHIFAPAKPAFWDTWEKDLFTQ